MIIYLAARASSGNAGKGKGEVSRAKKLNFGDLSPANIALILLAPVGTGAHQADPESEAAKRGEVAQNGEWARTNEFLIQQDSELSLLDLANFLGRATQPNPRISISYRLLFFHDNKA
jgi:hypothetical protein